MPFLSSFQGVSFIQAFLAEETEWLEVEVEEGGELWGRRGKLRVVYRKMQEEKEAVNGFIEKWRQLKMASVIANRLCPKKENLEVVFTEEQTKETPDSYYTQKEIIKDDQRKVPNTTFRATAKVTSQYKNTKSNSLSSSRALQKVQGTPKINLSNINSLDKPRKDMNHNEENLTMMTTTKKASPFRTVFLATSYWSAAAAAVAVTAAKKKLKVQFKKRTKLLMSAERLKDDQMKREYNLDRIRAAMSSFMFSFPDTYEAILYRRALDYWKVRLCLISFVLSTSLLVKALGLISNKTSLLPRVQGQIIIDAPLSIGKIHQFS